MKSETVTNTMDSQDAAFNNFVEISYEKLHWYALSLLPPSAAHSADDLVQDAYMRVFESMRRGSSPFKSFEGWNKYSPAFLEMMRYMRVVVKHVFLDLIQRSNSNDQLILNDQVLSFQDLDEFANVERFVLRQESNAELSSYIDKLPKSMQQIMRLKLEGLSSPEIANKLSKRPVTIRVSVMRATHLLRKLMTEDSQSHITRQPHNSVDSYNVSPAIRNRIARLPDPYRVVVAFHDVRHMSYSEIANMLHRSVSTVKSQYYRGKKKLQSLDSHAALQNGSDQHLSETVLTCLNYIHQLDGHLRDVVELHYVQKLSYSEIAKELKRPENTVKSWIYRAKKISQQYANPQSMSGMVKSSSNRRLKYTEDELEYIKEGILSPYKDVMKGYYVESHSIEDIAIKLGVSQGYVKSKIKRGRSLVKEHAHSWCETRYQ